MNWHWWYTLVAIAVLIVNGQINVWVYLWNNQRREKKWLKQLKIRYPGANIQLTTVSGSDHKALRKIKRQLEDVEDYRRNRKEGRDR